jgi:prevent-host-death family protein
MSQPKPVPGRIGYAQLRGNLSEVIRRVAISREPVTVTIHGRPAVRIVPLEPGETDTYAEQIAAWEVPAGTGRE